MMFLFSIAPSLEANVAVAARAAHAAIDVCNVVRNALCIIVTPVILM